MCSSHNLSTTEPIPLLTNLFTGFDVPCGGILEGDTGKFRYSPPAAGGENLARNCVWLVRASEATKILLTFSEILTSDDQGLILYPESSSTVDAILSPAEYDLCIVTDQCKCLHWG